MYIQSVTLQSADIIAQKQFFTDKLGLEVLSETDTTLSIQVGTSQLNFVYSDEYQPTHYAFEIPENQFAEAKAWLKDRVPLVKSPTGKVEFQSSDWNADMVYFEDADGNIAEFIARHNLQTARMMPFTGESIIRISEVGIVTPHVIQTVADLREYGGLKAWRGAGSETFTAVGDEHGLLIVVQEGRGWMPNDTVPATVRPLELVIETDSNFTLPNLPYAIQAADVATM